METQFSAKIKKLKRDNRGKYLNKEMTAVLKRKGIIHDLKLPYANESNGLPEHINHTIVTMVRWMILIYANVSLQVL
jgi:hypothetical protein